MKLGRKKDKEHLRLFTLHREPKKGKKEKNSNSNINIYKPVQLQEQHALDEC